jgi:hypothetical protein
MFLPDRRLVIRDRRAPSPSLRAGIDGWAEWELVDRGGRVVRGGQQHNLFLDQGLDLITYTDPSTVGPLRNNASFFSHAAVGTGSTAPAVSDVSLQAEVARTGTKISTSITRPANGSYDLMNQWEFDFGVANGNLTEWAIARGSSGFLCVRELFRDEFGDPVVITKTSDFKLRIRYTCRFTLSPISYTPGEYSFDITGIGTINGGMLWIGGAGAAAAYDLQVFGYTAAARTSFQLSEVTTPRYKTNVPSGYTESTNQGAIFDRDGVVSFSSYTNGTFTRKISSVFSDTDRANITGIRTLGLCGQYNTGSGGAALWGYAFVIDAADAFTKDNEHRLTINDFLTVSWDRA